MKRLLKTNEGSNDDDADRERKKTTIHIPNNNGSSRPSYQKKMIDRERSEIASYKNDDWPLLLMVVVDPGGEQH